LSNNRYQQCNNRSTNFQQSFNNRTKRV